MTRVGLVISIIAAFAACSGDDGETIKNTCGDGVVGGTEQCDDGNRMSGDGCDSVCQLDTAGTCGDGITVVTNEQCDDGNVVDGDGCSASCTLECGNGMLDGIEQCDDGNRVNGDGCATECLVESLYTCTGEASVCIKATGRCDDPFTVDLSNVGGTLQGSGMGDTTNGMNQVPQGSCDEWIDTGDAADHVWQFTIPDNRDVSITIDTSTAFDAVLRLSTTACDVSSDVVEHLGQDGCSDAGVDGDGEQLFYSNLPAGTYYVLIDGYDAASVGPYRFQVSASPTNCGNGMLEAPEQCDDGASATGPGCNDRCDVEPGYACDNSMSPSVCAVACGNGHLDSGEECDDANVVAGDRCSATCTLEYDVLEVEPNDTTPQTITAANHLIKGSMADGDYDVFTFTLTAASTVHLETYDSMDPDLDYNGLGNLTNVDCYNADTVVSILGATGNTALFSDDQDGTDSCSYIGPNVITTEGVLQPGTYRIKVEDFWDGLFGPIDRYILDVKITPN